MLGKNWDYTGTGKWWEKSGIDLGKLLSKVGLYGKTLGKVGLAWENCWEIRENAGKKWD
jgi:hypothetical protein